MEIPTSSILSLGLARLYISTIYVCYQLRLSTANVYRSKKKWFNTQNENDQTISCGNYEIYWLSGWSSASRK